MVLTRAWAISSECMIKLCSFKPRKKISAFSSKNEHLQLPSRVFENNAYPRYILLFFFLLLARYIVLYGIDS
jgi:hypothetical protein